MAGWVKRKTSYVTNPETGKAVAVSRVLTFAGGRTETLSASDLIGVTPEKRTVDGVVHTATDGVAQANYPTSGNLFMRTVTEMRAKATSLATELGLRTHAPSATRTTTPVARARALADELGTRTAPDDCSCECGPCKDGNCEGCDCGAGCDGESCDSETCRCADHRSAITATVGRTLYPIDRAAIQRQRELDEQIYEAQRRRRLAASSR
jgi:hypothetical protein